MVTKLLTPYLIIKRILFNKTWQLINTRPGLLVSAVIISYVASGCGSVFDVFVPIEALRSFNKYLIIVLVVLLAPKLMLKKRSRLKIPGMALFNLFMICVLIHGLYPGGDHWYVVASRPLRIYVLFLIIINFYETREGFDILGISFVLISIITLVAYYYHYKQYTYSAMVVSMVISEKMGLYINAHTLSYLGVLVYIVYSNIIKDKFSLWHLFMQILLFIGVAWIVIINASRGAFIILTVVAILSLPRIKRWKTITVSIGLVLLLGYVISPYNIYLMSVPHVSIFTKRLESIKRFQDSERAYIARYAFSKFLEDPLWGKGYDSILGSGYFGSTNHLWYLNLAVAYGIVGLVILLIWFTQVVRIKNVLSSRHSIMFLIFIFIFLFLGPPSIFLSVALAFLYHESNNEVVNKRNLVWSSENRHSV